VDHDAVRAVIDPAFIGITRDIDAAGADIAAAVLVVPERRRKLEHVDVAILLHVLHKRGFLDELRGHRFDLFIVFLPNPHEIHFGVAGRESESQSQTLARGERIGQHAVALGIAFDVLEKHGRAVLFMVHKLGDRTDF